MSRTKTIQISVPVCLVENCGRKVYARGLCGACIAKARRMVREGQSSWNEIERLGLIQPAAYRARGTSIFGQAFERAKAATATARGSKKPAARKPTSRKPAKRKGGA